MDSLETRTPSELLRCMAETEEELEKLFKESNSLEQEITILKESIKTINNYIDVVSKSHLYKPSNIGLSSKKRIILLNNEKREKLLLLKDLEDKWLDLTHFRLHQLQNQLDQLVLQEKYIFEAQFPAEKKSQDTPSYI